MLDNIAARHGLLIDLDGVIYQSGRIVAGAVEALDWLEQHGVPHLFVTNTTSRSRHSLIEKFEQLGFSAAPDEVMTPIVAAVQWLEARNMKSVALFLPEDSQRDFSALETVPPERSDAAVDAVVIGDLGSGWNFEMMNCAFRMLMHSPPPQLLALGMTRYWRAADGLQLDVAPFIKALEHAASCEAVVVGKPAAAFFAAALKKLGCEAQRTYMIGDDIVGDVDAAQRCGIHGIQVRTGKFRDADLDRGIKPEVVLDSFADLPGWWSQSVRG